MDRPTEPRAALKSVAAMMSGDYARTPVTIVLIALNLGIFAAMLMHGAGWWHSPNAVQLAWGANFGPATKDGEWWRLASAPFLHFGVLHLAMNMWALWDGGRLVERLYGSLRLLSIYVASGLAGNLLSLIVQGDRAVSGGASGAIFGVYGALLICLWRERRQVDAGEFRWLFWGALVFTAAAVGLGYAIPGIDNSSHVGGLVCGTLLGVVFARPLADHSPRLGASRWLAAGALTVAVAVLLRLVPDPAYRWHEEMHAREAISHFLSDDKRITERWQSILDSGKAEEGTFEDLAGRIEADVALGYRESFEALSALHLDPDAPSAVTLEVLRRYALLRGDAARSLAEALRLHDRERAREALEMARRAPYVARGVEPPPKGGGPLTQ